MTSCNTFAGFTERELLIGLTLVDDLGPVRIGKLIDFFGSVSAVYSAEAGELAHVDGAGPALAPKLAAGISTVPEKLEKLLQRLDTTGIKAVTQIDSGYPSNLKHIYDPPVVIYMKGKFIQDDALGLAVVGTRGATPYGIAVTEKFAGALARAGITIISGLALGIDTAAHQSALKAAGRTVAVLGSGVDIIYPTSNRRLAERVADTGVLLSEYPPGTEPERGHFPRRNRIIAGLALGVLVTEAPAKSGALITASLALDYGREVFVVPGSILSAKSEGTNSLLKQGSNPVTCAEDILSGMEAYRMLPLVSEKESCSGAASSVLTGAEAELLKKIPYEPVHMDILLAGEGDISELAKLILTLELKGLVRKTPGNKVVRVA